MRKAKKVIRTILILFFVSVIIYSGYQIFLIQKNYTDEAKVHDMVMQYKPDEKQDKTNQKIVDLQEKYKDVVGWITIPNTKVDYPFIWYKDNDYYLRRDLNGKWALAGTIFIDYRCEKDFTKQNTIIYGHHMKNGTMFGSLKSFEEKKFFDENKVGTIFLRDDTLTLEIFAYIVVNAKTEQEVYNIELSDNYLDYIKQNARNYREIELTQEDRIVTLSSCSYEFNNARMVLLAKIIND